MHHSQGEEGVEGGRRTGDDLAGNRYIHTRNRVTLSLHPHAKHTYKHAIPEIHTHTHLRFRLINFTHNPFLSRNILISVSMPMNNPRKNRKGVGTDLRHSFTCDLIRPDVINGQDIRIRLELRFG